MLRRLNPEISLGALLATIFWIGVLGWQSSYSLTEIEKQECQETAKKNGRKAEDCKTLWEKTTSDPVALFTFVLAISTIGLWGATVFLYRAGERQIAVARTAANAADLSARAAIALELPIIRIEIDTLGHGESFDGTTRTESCYINLVQVTNRGAKKAFPKEIIYGWAVGDARPDEPAYEHLDKFPHNSILDANSQNLVSQRLTGVHILNAGEWSKICRGNYLWFYCAIIYEDFMEETHSHGFCWRWTNIGMGVALRRNPAPAYNRKT